MGPPGGVQIRDNFPDGGVRGYVGVADPSSHVRSGMFFSVLV